MRKLPGLGAAAGSGESVSECTMILSDVPARHCSAGYAQRPSPTALRQMVEVAKKAPSGTGGRQPRRCTLLPPYRARLGRRRRVRAEPINGPKRVSGEYGEL